MPPSFSHTKPQQHQPLIHHQTDNHHNQNENQPQPQTQSDKLDDIYTKTMEQIETVCVDLPKHLRIRVEAWSNKLCQVHSNPVFLRNRNAHALLLLSCCQTNNWVLFVFFLENFVFFLLKFLYYTKLKISHQMCGNKQCVSVLKLRMYKCTMLNLLKFKI